MSFPTGQLITDPKLINDRLFSFYSQLYASEPKATVGIAELLNALDIPVLGEVARQEMDSDFTP